MGIFYREKTFHAGKTIRKNDFVPSEKYACLRPCKTQQDKFQNDKELDTTLSDLVAEMPIFYFI